MCSDVKELDNQDPLEDINLDFSLPFPQANAAIPYKEPKFTRDFAPLDHLIREERETEGVKPSVSASYPEGADPQEEVNAMVTENNAAPTRRTSARSAKSRQNSFGRGAGVDHGSPKIPEPRMTAAQRKHAALQEKNRRAQRRFRERQKQRVAELEDQVAALEAQLAALTRENEALNHRNGQLEKGDTLNGPPEMDKLPNGDSAPSRESKMIAVNGSSGPGNCYGCGAELSEGRTRYCIDHSRYVCHEPGSLYQPLSWYCETTRKYCR